MRGQETRAQQGQFAVRGQETRAQPGRAVVILAGLRAGVQFPVDCDGKRARGIGREIGIRPPRGELREDGWPVPGPLSDGRIAVHAARPRK